MGQLIPKLPRRRLTAGVVSCIEMSSWPPKGVYFLKRLAGVILRVMYYKNNRQERGQKGSDLGFVQTVRLMKSRLRVPLNRLSFCTFAVAKHFRRLARMLEGE